MGVMTLICASPTQRCCVSAFYCSITSIRCRQANSICLHTTLKKFRVDHQQPERLAIFLRLFGMMRTVRPQDRPRIATVQLPEPGKPLVDIDVVYQEINSPVDGNAQPDEEQPGVRSERTCENAGNAGCGENEEEEVVFFEEFPLLKVRFVVVFVPVPQEPVHDVFMGKPRYEFHPANRDERDKEVR